MKKTFKVFVIRYRDWYWYEGDEGDGQFWVKDLQLATLYSEKNAKMMGLLDDEGSPSDRIGILKDLTLNEQYGDYDGNPEREIFRLEELPVLEEIK